MSKLIFGTAFILINCLILVAMSQTFNYKPSSAAPTTNSASPFLSETPLPTKSPADFRKGVDSLSKQRQDNLSQQLKQSLRPMPVQGPSEPPPPEGTPKPQPKPEEMQQAPTTPAAPTESTETPSSMMTPSQQPTQPSTPAIQQPQQPPPPAQTQTYTGFGAGGGQGQTNQSQPAGGGWNIKY